MYLRVYIMVLPRSYYPEQALEPNVKHSPLHGALTSTIHTKLTLLWPTSTKYDVPDPWDKSMDGLPEYDSTNGSHARGAYNL